jgi:hypothetical protein
LAERAVDHAVGLAAVEAGSLADRSQSTVTIDLELGGDLRDEAFAKLLAVLGVQEEGVDVGKELLAYLLLEGNQAALLMEREILALDRRRASWTLSSALSPASALSSPAALLARLEGVANFPSGPASSQPSAVSRIRPAFIKLERLLSTSPVLGLTTSVSGVTSLDITGRPGLEDRLDGSARRRSRT